jgi:hypothetical protein
MSVDYKYKPEKHKFRVNLKTIDEIHKEQLDDFKKNRSLIPDKKNKLLNLELELKEIEEENRGKPIGLNFELLKHRNILRNLIKNLKEEIDKIENCSAEMEYWSRTGDVLCDYYDITNGILYGKNFDGMSIEIDNNQEINNFGNQYGGQINSKIIISDELLAITNLNRKRKLKKPVRKRNKKIEMTPIKGIMSILLGDNEEDNEQDNKTCKASLQNQYLLMMDKEYACSKTKTSIAKKCKRCNLDTMIIYNESIITCPKCGESDDIFIESDMPSQRETFAEKPKYPYKKLGHCIEKLNQFLCKGTVNIPSEIFIILNEEIEKHNMNKNEVTIKFLEAMLKKHRLSEYYENIMYIFSKITGKPPQHISRDEYDLVLKMFGETEEVYETKYKPSTRNNFLKYTFVLNKIFLTIGRPEIASHFKLLKSPDKLKQQERVWQKICLDLGWKYHSS